MANLPYVTSPGNISKALNAIKNASVPERVSLDFVKTILKIPGGSGDQMTSFLKKLGLVNTDGSPSDIYKKFRNPSSSGIAIATSMKIAYAPLYARNEFAHELSDHDLIGLITEETGEPHDSNTVKLAASCFKYLKGFADFRGPSSENQPPTSIERQVQNYAPSPTTEDTKRQIGFNLGYTINLNLPATSDSAVFDAIFRSLRENLLRGEDG